MNSSSCSLIVISGLGVTQLTLEAESHDGFRCCAVHVSTALGLFTVNEYGLVELPQNALNASLGRSEVRASNRALPACWRSKLAHIC